MEADERVATGLVRVNSSSVESTVDWQGVVEIDGRRHPLTSARTVIGRGSDADITIADAGSSRRHAEILWDGERGMLRDLGSTNGTKVDGHKIREVGLTPGTSFTIGRTQLTFQVVPASPSSRRGAAHE
jgi:pSer/pThr/pTyr-binding forkhead associated (FHA) protein